MVTLRGPSPYNLHMGRTNPSMWVSPCLSLLLLTPPCRLSCLPPAGLCPPHVPPPGALSPSLLGPVPGETMQMAMSRTCSSSCKSSFFSPTWNLMRGSISSRVCPARRQWQDAVADWGAAHPSAPVSDPDQAGRSSFSPCCCLVSLTYPIRVHDPKKGKA